MLLRQVKFAITIKLLTFFSFYLQLFTLILKTIPYRIFKQVNKNSKMNQKKTSAASPAQNPDSILIDHIKSFLHLTTQAPLEYVCKSSLYLLTNVPATRLAVFEYLGTFYKVSQNFKY